MTAKRPPKAMNNQPERIDPETGSAIFQQIVSGRDWPDAPVSLMPPRMTTPSGA
jgi:hypothetical protein